MEHRFACLNVLSCDNRLSHEGGDWLDSYVGKVASLLLYNSWKRSEFKGYIGRQRKIK